MIILLAPVVGTIWVRLGARNPSMAIKFGIGLILLAVGFVVMAWASMSLRDGKVGMQWLVATYFFHTVGELCLSPVGLSSMTKLAPGRLVGQMMGVWFLGAAIGNLVAGLVTRFVPRDRDDRGGHPERRAALQRGRGDRRRGSASCSSCSRGRSGGCRPE